MRPRHLFALVSVVGILHAKIVAADNFFPEDSTIDGPLENITVGYASFTDNIFGINGTSPTVSVIAGGSFDLGSAFNGSSLIVDGGFMLAMTAFDHASVILKTGGGTAFGPNGSLFGNGALGAHDQGSVIMSGGITVGVTALDHGTVNVTGGEILSRVDMKGNAIGTISGVTIGNTVNGVFAEGLVNTFDEADLELSAVEIGLAVRAVNSSKIALSESTVHGAVEGFDATTLEISGGTIEGSVFAFNLSMTGGSVLGGAAINGTNAVGTINASTIESAVSVNGAGASLSVSGGEVGGGASAGGGSTLTLSGLEIAQSVNGFNATILANTVNVAHDFSVQASGAQSTATIADSQIGGNLATTGGLSAIKNASLTLTGGTVAGDVTANDRSAISLIDTTVAGNVTANSGSSIGSLVEIQGGSVGNATAKGNGGEVRLLSGTVAGDLTATNRANVNIFGGDVEGNLALENRASGIMGGGSIAGAANLDATTFTMIDGNIAGVMTVGGFSHFILSGGTLAQGLVLQGESTTNMDGGSIAGDGTSDSLAGNVFVSESSTLEMSGGVANKIRASGEADVTLSGGQVDSGVSAIGSSNITISGSTVDSAVIQENAALVMTAGAVRNDVTLNVTGPIGESGKISFVMGGGTVGGDLDALGIGSAALEGGSIAGTVHAFGESLLFVNGTAFIAGNLEATGDSTVNVEGGGIGKHALAFNHGTLNVSGTAFIAGNLQAQGDGTVNLSDGRVGGNLQHFGILQMTMSGGNVTGNVTVDRQSPLVISGGTIEGNLEAHGTVQHSGAVNGDATAFGGTLVVSGGQVGGRLISQQGGQVEVLNASAITGVAAAFDSSSLTIMSGSIGVGASPGDLEASGNSTVNLGGGTVGKNLEGFDRSTINMSGGTVFGAGIFKIGATFNFYGGRVIGGIFKETGLRAFAAATVEESPQSTALAEESLHLSAFDNAVINLYGSGLVATLVEPNSEGMSLYELTGTLADGTVLDGGIVGLQNGSQATQHLLLGANWNLDGGGDWGEAANWVSGVIPEGVGAYAGFTGALTQPNAPASIVLGDDRTIGILHFNNEHAYMIDGPGILTLNNSGTAARVDVLQGNHAIRTDVQLADDAEVFVASGAALAVTGGIAGAGHALAKTGAGELNLHSVEAEGLDIQAGNARLDGDGTVERVSVGAGGTLELVGATLVAPRVEIGTDGRLSGHGSIVGDVNNFGTVAPGTLANDVASLGLKTPNENDALPQVSADLIKASVSAELSILDPNGSLGKLEILGDYQANAAATLEIKLGGIKPELEYDVLSISETAQLAGILAIDLINDFVPEVGASFDVLLAQSIGGQFESMQLPGLAAGLAWRINYLLDPNGTDRVQLAVAPVPLPSALWLFVVPLATLFRSLTHKGKADSAQEMRRRGSVS